MPTKVFFNLNNEKQERIMNEAIKEFSNYRLENASIKRIVEGSKIARGSFYQYFEDIDDIFIYTNQYLNKANHVDMMKHISSHQDSDIIELLRKSFISRMKSSFSDDGDGEKHNVMIMVSKSIRAQEILSRNVGGVKNQWDLRSIIDLASINGNLFPNEIRSIIEMSFSTAKQVVIKILNKSFTVEEAIKELNFRLDIISIGMNELRK